MKPRNNPVARMRRQARAARRRGEPLSGRQKAALYYPDDQRLRLGARTWSELVLEKAL